MDARLPPYIIFVPLVNLTIDSKKLQIVRPIGILMTFDHICSIIVFSKVDRNEYIWYSYSLSCLDIVKTPTTTQHNTTSTPHPTTETQL